jgi:hypothetical protein
MKKRKIDKELYNIFSDIYLNEDDCQEALKESMKAYSIVKQDALFRSKTIHDHDE